ncbi:MAG: hypothetical protein IT452_00405 [Planctomycetia bacterium]|nr:hypothetical protein [Planctomycetia bacterium]
MRDVADPDLGKPSKAEADTATPDFCEVLAAALHVGAAGGDEETHRERDRSRYRPKRIHCAVHPLGTVLIVSVVGAPMHACKQCGQTGGAISTWIDYSATNSMALLFRLKQVLAQSVPGSDS